jgi:hypothetical protein
MKTNVRDVYSRSNRNAERLDRAIEVLVVKSIFIVPDASAGVRYLETHKPNTVGSGSGLDLVYRRTGPSRDRRMFSYSGSCAAKTERLVNSGYGVWFI